MSDLRDPSPAPTLEADPATASGDGRFIWYELMTSDQDAAIAFYKAVIGWTAEDRIMTEMGGFRYTILSAGDREVGGLMQINDEMCEQGARPGWLGYVGVADTDAQAQRFVEAGGSIHMPPDDIPGIGRFALVSDPGGAVLYLMTPLPQGEAPPPAAPDMPGIVSWHELYAGDGQEAAFAFYAREFGWETVDSLDMGEMGQYRIFGIGGVPTGGMMDKPAQVPAPAWTFYINVDGIDDAISRIQANGGSLMMGPHQVPGGSWIAQAMDPQGAFFAVVSNSR